MCGGGGLNHHILLNAESCRFAVGRGGGLVVYNTIGEAGMSYFTTKSGEGRAVEAKNSGLTNVITGPQIAICIT